MQLLEMARQRLPLAGGQHAAYIHEELHEAPGGLVGELDVRRSGSLQ